MVIMSQYIHISSHHIVCLKFPECNISIIFQWRLKKSSMRKHYIPEYLVNEYVGEIKLSYITDGKAK